MYFSQDRGYRYLKISLNNISANNECIYFFGLIRAPNYLLNLRTAFVREFTDYNVVGKYSVYRIKDKLYKLLQHCFQIVSNHRALYL